MRDRHTRRAVLGAIGGTAALGLWGGTAAAQADNWPTYGERADYWEVTPSSAATAVTEPTRGVSSEGDVVVARGVAVDGSIEADGHVFLGDGVTVAGPVETTGALVTGSIVDLDGGAEAGDDALLGVDILAAKEAYEAGELATIGDLPIGEGVFTMDDVASAGDVVVGPRGDVAGSVAAGSTDVPVGDGEAGAEDSGDGEADDRGRAPGVLLGTEVIVSEGVSAPGVVVVGSDGDVGGDVTAGPLALFGDRVTINGGISAARIDQGARADVYDRPDRGR